MRPIIIAISVLAAACSGQAPESPTSPAALTAPLTQQPARAATRLPFQGSYTSTDGSTFSPPITLIINGTAAGTATQLGRFSATFTHFVNVTNATATGTMTFTAANGDWLRADLTGQEDEFIEPNISRTTVHATIVEGSGRFGSATGAFTIHHTGVIDFAAQTSTGSASFDGTISLNK